MLDLLITLAVILVFLGLPLALTVMEILLLARPKWQRLRRWGRCCDLLTILLGIIYSLLYLLLCNVDFSADWTEQLFNNERHTPIWTEAAPAVILVVLVGIGGYLLLNFIPLKRSPPLLPVLGLSAMYLGTALSIVWAVQVFIPLTWEWSSWTNGINDRMDCFLLLLPLNCLLITARSALNKVREWQGLPDKEGHLPVPLRWCDRLLMDSRRWPMAALVLMWPLLGIIVVWTVLLGQQPNALIKAWTETSDWTLSQREAPQNLYQDMHYLCTVAAGGHEKVVKPLRMGVRHGHRVVVNRQLCVANAFEQLLEEKTPGLHRAVRGFYDRYGLPIARLIRTKYAADAVYLLMKPLEWLFLLALYCFDPRPEDRIAVQYTGRGVEDF